MKQSKNTHDFFCEICDIAVEASFKSGWALFFCGGVFLLAYGFGEATYLEIAPLAPRVFTLSLVLLIQQIMAVLMAFSGWFACVVGVILAFSVCVFLFAVLAVFCLPQPLVNRGDK